MTDDGGLTTPGCPALASRVDNLRSFGAIILDVDDTLLARGGIDRPGESYAESRTATILPRLLAKGVRLALVTGHGWQQLKARLLDPIRDEVGRRSESFEIKAMGLLRVYANRGATKVAWDGSEYRIDPAYSEVHGISVQHRASILHVLNDAAVLSSTDRELRADWYRRYFPRFDGWRLPTIDDREGGALVLRPVPSAFHAVGPVQLDPRARLATKVASALEELGIGDEYDVIPDGRSSISVYRRGVTKAGAVRDLIAVISNATGRTKSEIEEALVYVGDEFEADGNDAVIPQEFPGCLCYSVGPQAPSKVPSPRVLSASDQFGGRGTGATGRLLMQILEPAKLGTT